MSVVKDKMAVMQVLGSLINDPLLLLNPKYPLELEYFPEGFHRYLFTAIEYLIKNKATSITYIDIDNFLSKYKNQYAVFNENKGVEYIQNVQKLAEVDNYPYYYLVLKKMCLLNDLNKLGLNTKLLYDNDVIDPAEANIIQERFDKMDIEDIIGFYKNPLLSLEAKYAVSTDIQKFKAGESARALKESFKQRPEMGLPLNSKKLTTIYSGRRLKTFYLTTAVTNMGKTRTAVADACLVSMSSIYDIESEKWIENNFSTPTLLMVTEQENVEIEPMLWAYISGVEQQHIMKGKYKSGEEERVDKAIEIVENSPLYYVIIGDYDYQDIELIVTEHKQKYGITHFFFDYLHETEKLLSETGKNAGTRNLRTDQVLGMVSSKLKNLGKRLNIHVSTSTQSNDQIKAVLFADQSVIRGARSIADKPDIASVIMPLSKADEEFAKQHSKGFAEVPNMVYHVYKVRSGSINKVKVWVYFDYGTLRTYDCFVTKANNELINVPDTEIELILDSNETKVSKYKEKKEFEKSLKTLPSSVIEDKFDEDDF